MRRRDKPGLIIRQQSPLNLEYQFATLTDWLIRSDQFYVRNHFPTPELHAADWRLRVGGAVETPLTLSLADLQALPTRTMTAVVECAGNGRILYIPPKEGLQWHHGAVGNAAWTGVLLSDVLKQAGISAKAVEVVLAGADQGTVDGGKKTGSPGPIAFARSLPLGKALSDSVLLAWAMNDEPLSTEHGYPLRAVVGGWYGMAWIKWLSEIRVVETPFLGYWQARDYFMWDRSHGEPSMRPLTEMQVKAQIARPVNDATIEIGRVCRIFGAAWAGEAGIGEVLVGTEENGSWQAARLTGPDTPYGWRLFEFEWTPRREGRHMLRARAIDKAGNAQPLEPQPDRESYAVNWVDGTEVSVVAGREPEAEEFVI